MLNIKKLGERAYELAKLGEPVCTPRIKSNRLLI